MEGLLLMTTFFWGCSFLWCKDISICSLHHLNILTQRIGNRDICTCQFCDLFLNVIECLVQIRQRCSGIRCMFSGFDC